MKHILFTAQQITEKISFTKEDIFQINQCRRSHNKLGFAYQMAFVRFLGRFPNQVQFEIIDELLDLVSDMLSLDPEKISIYSHRRETVTKHQEQIRIYLKLKKFNNKEIEKLEKYIYTESLRIERKTALLAKAEEFLRNRNILLPAISTLDRIISNQRKQARIYIFKKIRNLLNPEIIENINKLLIVEEGEQSIYQEIKAPPGFPSPKEFLALIKKLKYIKSTGILQIDISWINNNFQKSLARRARNSSAYRIRELHPLHRYTVMLCFLWQSYQDTIDHAIDMHCKLITSSYQRSEDDHEKELTKKRKTIKDFLKTFKTIGLTILDENICESDVRKAIFQKLPQNELEEYLLQAEEWISGKKSHPFLFFMNRFSYLRQYSPCLLEHLTFNLESEVNNSIAEGLEIVKNLNKDGKRKIPENTDLSFIPKKLKQFLNPKGQIDRKAFECALLLTLRDEIKRGNIWIKDSKRFVKLDDFFITNSEWNTRRKGFFINSGLPANPADVPEYLTERLNKAYDKFLNSLDENTFVTFDENEWSLSKNISEKLTKKEEKKLDELENWLKEKLRTIKLPELLIEVNNDLQYTRHFIDNMNSKNHLVNSICSVITAIIAYGCNIGPYTMAQLTNNISYDEIKRIADWNFYDENLRAALADIVNGISRLSTTKVWGEGKTSSSDGQRFLFPKKALNRTYSHKLSDYAIEFYSFVADNYAPFYSIPIECNERDAAYVLDGLLYHETDLNIEEHYVDTHGYTELNFAAFAMLGKKFYPRIRGLQKQWIYKIDTNKNYGPLEPIVRPNNKTIHLDWICNEWDRMAQFYESLRSGHTTASIALKRLVSFGTKNQFYSANKELGRVFKTEFILNYLSDPLLRRRIHRGLLKMDQLHSLARNVHYGKQGKIYARDLQQQLSNASCLLIILACIVYWQAKEIENIFTRYIPEKDGIDISLMPHISPIGWENILLYGQYIINRNLVQYP